MNRHPGPLRVWLRAVAMLVAGILCWPAGAQEPGPATGPAIAFVDMQRLLDNAPQFKEWRTRLQAEFAERNRELQAEATSIEELKRKRDEPGLSAADVQVLERRIAAAERGLKRARTTLEDVQNLRRAEALEAINKLIGEAAAGAARERGFSAVLTREYAVYIDPALDLTDAVLARLRQAPALPAPGP